MVQRALLFLLAIHGIQIVCIAKPTENAASFIATTTDTTTIDTTTIDITTTDTTTTDTTTIDTTTIDTTTIVSTTSSATIMVSPINTTTVASSLSVTDTTQTTLEIEIAHGNDNEANVIADEEIDYRREYAAQMMSYMNLSIDPCEDFYEYACGNWKNVIRPRQAEHKRNNLLDIVYKLGDIAELILQRPHIDDIAPEYAAEFELAKKFYNNCIESELHPMRQSEVFLNIIKSIGGFPAIEAQWNATAFSWLNMSAHMSNYGINNLIKEGIIPQYPFPPYFQIPDFGFDIEIHYDTIKNTSSNAYQVNQKRMLDILELYDVADDKRQPIVDDIFGFLKAVLNVIEEFDEDSQKCTLLSLLMDEDDIDALEEQWLHYYQIAWEGKAKLFEDGDRPCAYLYYKVNQITEKNTEAVANYLALKFLYHMDSRLKDVQFQKDYCVLSIRRAMAFFFDHVYMKVFFNNDIRNDVQNMMAEIRQSLHSILKDADWLDEVTREAALLKESTMGEYIGRLEEPEMTKRLIAEMKNLTFVEDDIDTNLLSLRKFRQYMNRYNGLHFDEMDNTTKPLDLLVGMQVNSFYYNIDNAIYVMAGVLHPPSFHKAWPNVLKYGTLGFLVGHEFTHGFDTVGANYDEEGSNNYWWSSKSGKVFDERSRCYVDHYQNYTIPEINRHVNGNMTKDENIADAGGVRMALMAYRRYVKEITKNSDSSLQYYKDEQMPGLDLSPEQLFFLGAAQLWCSSYKEAHYWEELSDEHTIDKYRVLGIASNSDDFSKAFNCPQGSNMNPLPQKCSIW